MMRKHAHIVADDALVESKLRDLVKLTMENGAIFHPKIEIISTKGELRIESKLEPSNNDAIIYLPDSCLPRLDDFDVELEGDDINFQQCSDKVSSLHVEIFGMLMELFNLTGKIKIHKQTFPWLIFANSKSILECLHQGRSYITNKYYNYYKAGDFENLALKSYLGTRFVNHPYQDGHGMKPALMPIIDCVNHHSDATRLRGGSPYPEVKEGLMVRNSKPLENSNECFYRYTKTDAISSYMSYGFVDHSTQIMRSIPLTISLPNTGTIYVYAYTYSKDADKIPSVFNDIKYYFPEIRRTGKQELRVSHLMIPPKSAANALRRILEFLISSLSEDLTKTELKRLVRKCENQILKENEKYYKKLQSLVKAKNMKSISSDNILVLNQLIHGQLDKLSVYRKRKK